MSVQQFDFLYKLYIPAGGTLTRAHFILENDPISGNWITGDVLFPLNQNSRLLQVSAQVSPLYLAPVNATMGPVTQPINPRWFFYGKYLTINGNEILSQSPNFPLGSIYLFPMDSNRLYMSSENPVFRPECLFCGGFRIQQIGVYFQNSYTLPQDYWGRLRMSWEFEV